MDASRRPAPVPPPQVTGSTIRRFPSTLAIPVALFLVLVGVGVFAVAAGQQATIERRKEDATQLASVTLTAVQLTVQQVTRHHLGISSTLGDPPGQCRRRCAAGLPLGAVAGTAGAQMADLTPWRVRFVQAYTTVAALGVYLERHPLWPPFEQSFNSTVQALLQTSGQVGCARSRCPHAPWPRPGLPWMSPTLAPHVAHAPQNPQLVQVEMAANGVIAALWPDWVSSWACAAQQGGGGLEGAVPWGRRCSLTQARPPPAHPTANVQVGGYGFDILDEAKCEFCKEDAMREVASGNLTVNGPYLLGQSDTVRLWGGVAERERESR